MTESDPTISQLSETHLGESALLAFIEEMDDDFVPPLSQRVDLSNYAKRLYASAVNLVVTDACASRILALASFYCTPGRFDVASLSYIAVAAELRGRNVGLRLMREMHKYAADANMSAVETRTWSGNFAMIKLLEQAGYVLTDEKRDEQGRRTRYFRCALSGPSSAQVCES